ncbi:MAG: phosphoribosylformylglycinamidine synthase [Planctomycetes bacterium]|nr:phosphoribosylformylglycinamidine synthase [Planctomycetota bacterium]
MVTRLEIAIREDLEDPRGTQVMRHVREYLGLAIHGVRTRDVYLIDAPEQPLSSAEERRVLQEFVNPTLQVGALARLAPSRPFDVVVAVAYKPGVTDPVGKSAMVAIKDTLGRPLGEGTAVFTSQLYLLDGVDVATAETIATGLLANPIIQTVEVFDRATWLASEPSLHVPRVTTEGRPTVATVDLTGSDAELERISREGLLALSLREMQTIRDHFLAAGSDERRRAMGLTSQPTDVELECLAQTWSEHCKHKIFNARITYHEPGKDPVVIHSLYKSYVQRVTKELAEQQRAREGASWLVSVFKDNAGVVAFDEHDHLVYKVETHNSPSALDPYGGAITGIVGVNRDPFGTGLGSDLMSNVWGYCFGPPDFDGELPAGLMHPRRIRDGVHHGVIDGGNQSGVPYGRGFELFDLRFLGKPLVFCGTVGRMPVTIAGQPGETKGARKGDLIVMTGGRIGADGIHGATFSSAALDETAPVQAVQIGDPITQKCMFDFLLEAREEGLYTAITDNGAGGLSSSVGEMAEVPGGARLDLSRAPLKYAGLAPWEVLVSEAQERMTLAVPPENVERVLALAARREVEATVLGEFTDDGYFHVTWGDEVVAHLSMEFLHDGAPDLDLVARWNPPVFAEPSNTAVQADLGTVLCEMLARCNVRSHEDKARHYDHEVKALTIVKPWIGVGRDVPSEGTVFMARHDSWRGYVLSEGVNPFLSDLDTRSMAMSVVDEAVRRQLCAGARLDRIAVLDNFCWPDPVQSAITPDGEYKLAQLVRACQGLYDATYAYGTPLISGKDSMKNDSTMGGVRISIPPTLLVSAIGQIDDVRKAVTLDPKQEGDVVFLLGETRGETGASEYFRWRGEREGAPREPGGPAPWVGTRVPTLDAQATRALYEAFERATRAGLVRSAATPTRGGLAVAFAKQVMAAELGMRVDLSGTNDDLTPDQLLFEESNGRFVVTTSREDADDFVAHFEGRLCTRIGEISNDARLVITGRGDTWLDRSVAELKHAYKSGFEGSHVG